MWELQEVTVPASGQPDNSATLLAYVDVANAVTLDTWGEVDFCRDALEVLGSLRAQAYERKVRLVALEDGRPVGYGALNLPQRDNTHTGYVELGVLPDDRRRGIGSALYHSLLAIARDSGRTRVTASTDFRTEAAPDQDALVAPTGSGRVPADDPGARFLLARGWRLEQVERRSVLHLPLPAGTLDGHLADAQAVAGDDYRLVLWDAHCPDEWVDSFAYLQSRMSTDAPTGGLDYREETWDAARVRDQEHEFAERRLGYLAVAAEHVPSRTLVAYSAFLTVPHTDAYVHQHDTLVVAEHRGHRLGMLVKAANLQRLERDLPAVRRVGTWNAEENSYMLAINVRLGFAPEGGAGEWQLDL
ncbi:GNAT family N-acetyltransferase [Cellulomonas sp. HZM]|uniref:GNAT family N-acetyltransferase n=1 Tax=Cellulomonas sp. HZM TaxID=1454010 RepID=UPI00049360D8|nr:GNAT family N-acetyltransferase [Cellulomonas sp. HZM]